MGKKSLASSVVRRASFPRPARRVPADGFTFLELILVLVIISVAMAIVGPMIGSRLKSGDPRRTARQLRAAMELMRVRAVQRGQVEILVVDPDPEVNAYWSERAGKRVEVPPEGGLLSAQGRWVREDGTVEFRFYPDGTNSGGAVRIERRRGVLLTAYTLSLDPLLGIATVQRDED